MSESKLIIRKRNIAYSRLVEIYNYGKDNTNDAFYKENFLSRVSCVNTIYDEFQTLHNDVISLCADEDFEEQDKTRKTADKVFYSIKSKEMQINAAADAALAAAQTSSSNARSITNVNSNIRLPKLNVPHFDGNPLSWPTFYDIYTNTIHNNQDLADIEKFQHLLPLLNDEPLNLIRMTPLTDANYTVAYGALMKRYQDTRFLATDYFNEIYHYSPLINPSAGSIRHLVDTFSENLAALKGLNFGVDAWDFLLFNILLEKLDQKNRTEFELAHSKILLPTFEQLMSHLEERCKALISAEGKPSLNMTSKSTKKHSNLGINSRQNNHNLSFVASTEASAGSSGTKCPCCKAVHYLSKCSHFLSKNPFERFQLVKQHKLCLNCFRVSHSAYNCPSVYRCRTCKAATHTLLHFNKSNGDKSNDNTGVKPNEVPLDSAETNAANMSLTMIAPINDTKEYTVLLSTSLVEIQDVHGVYHKFRALLDTASMANFISDRCANKLGLKRFATSTTIEGLNQHTSQVNKGALSCQIRPCQRVGPVFTVKAIVLPKICSELPKVHIDIRKLGYLNSLNLADANFHRPSQVDMLLGAEFFPQILLSNHIRNNVEQPVAIETLFGYIVQGKAEGLSSSTSLITCCSTIAEPDIPELLQKFWTLETVPEDPFQHKKDIRCEQHFVKNTYRLDSGQFVVSLPFKIKNPTFGNTYSQALRRFLYLEARFQRNPKFYDLYSSNMKEYKL